MPLVCIRGYLKSVLVDKYLILDTFHPDTLYLRQQRCEWLFFKARRSLQLKLGQSRIKVITKKTDTGIVCFVDRASRFSSCK